MDRRTSAPLPRCQNPTFQHEPRAELHWETASSGILLALSAHGGPPFPGLASLVPSRVCTLLTSRSMTARSARCQARSSVSSSDCSRNSWPGTVRIWGWRVGEPGGEKACVIEENQKRCEDERPRVTLSLGTRGRHSRAGRSGGWTAGARWPGLPRAGPRYSPAGSQPAPGNYERNRG